MNTDQTREPTPAEIAATSGPLVLEFGAGWCSICRAAQPMLSTARSQYPHILHRSVEDGPGRPLGRSFRVKLWPTLVFLKDGQVVSQASRPELGEVRKGLAEIAGDA